MGLETFDKGEIKIFGREVVYGKTLKITNSLGFMPQESKLFFDLTIRETLEFYARIYQMKVEDFNERFNMIHELLDFPSEDLKVQHLSGGQQKSVSFAISIIHNPKILILDEPLVELDMVLRENIWDFLFKSTRVDNLTVFMTTHYFAEAQKADCCGYIRRGKLIFENSSENLIKALNFDHFDEALLSICLMKDDDVIKIPKGGKEFKSVVLSESDYREVPNIKKQKFRPQIMKGLFVKEMIAVQRQYS